LFFELEKIVIASKYEVFAWQSKETTPTFANAKATPPQEGNFGERSLKFPSRGGVANPQGFDGVFKKTHLR